MNSDLTTNYCSNHPNTETKLRCNRCEKFICSKCAIHTPTGYRCQECLQGQQKAFESALWQDYPIAFFIAGILSFIGSLLASRLGFFTIFIAPIAGTVIAEAVRVVIQKRRGKLLFKIATAGALIGSLPLLITNGFYTLIGMLLAGNLTLFSLLPILWLGIYSSIVTSTVYYRISGLIFKR
jgi:hypothetical protein